MSERPALHCAGCGKAPAEIAEYVDAALVEQTTPELFVWDDEGTLDRASGAFLCTDCYIKLGMPTTQNGWKATTVNMAALYGVDL